MNTEPNDPINEVYEETLSSGLTKREYFAAMFTAAQLQGIVAASGNMKHGWMDKDFARVGISIADALIVELNKP